MNWFEQIATLVAGGFAVFVYMKVRELENLIYNFPTAMDIAKEVVKIKLPVSELPEDLKKLLKSGIPPGAVQGYPPYVPPPQNKPPSGHPTYVG